MPALHSRGICFGNLANNTLADIILGFEGNDTLNAAQATTALNGFGNNFYFVDSIVDVTNDVFCGWTELTAYRFRQNPPASVGQSPSRLRPIGVPPREEDAKRCPHVDRRLHIQSRVKQFAETFDDGQSDPFAGVLMNRAQIPAVQLTRR